MEKKVTMGSNLKESFGEEKPKRSEEAHQGWRKLRGYVTNRKRQLCCTADPSKAKRNEAAAMRHANQVSRFSFSF
jgi:hypothetical protein